MTTNDVANKLVELCRAGENMTALEQLYADNCTSREMPGMPNDFVEGKAAILEKTNAWYESVEEIHSGEVSDPSVVGNHFSCTMSFDVTFKERGRCQIDEICVFEVKDGKIVAEQFFYTMG